MTEQAQVEPKTETVNRTLYVKFSEAERREKSDSLVRAIECHAEIEDEKKEANADFKQKLASEKSLIKRLTHELGRDGESRRVDCTLTRDFSTNSVFVTRNDTGEEVERRAMEAQERQASLFVETEGERAEVLPPAENPLDEKPLTATVEEQVTAAAADSSEATAEESTDEQPKKGRKKKTAEPEVQAAAVTESIQ